MSNLETQADLFSRLAYRELVWELHNGQCPDMWEWEKFIIAGRLAIFGASDE